MLEILNLGALVALILVVWFNTSAVPEYIQLFKREYLAAKSLDQELHYGLFLYRKYPNFFTKIGACYVCSSVWISVFLSYWCDALGYFGLVNVLGLILYSGMNWLGK